MKKAIALLVLGMLLTISRPGFAEPSPWTKEEKYADKASQKFSYGMGNFYLGWSEIFNEPIKHHEGIFSALKSVGRGFALFPVDTVGGLFHMVTCPITTLDMPLPDGGIQPQKYGGTPTPSFGLT